MLRLGLVMKAEGPKGKNLIQFFWRKINIQFDHQTDIFIMRNLLNCSWIKFFVWQN